MAVDLWSVESRLYAEIDAAGMRGRSTYRKRFDLGDGHKVETHVKVFSGTLSNHQKVLPNQLEFGANFWSGTQPYYRLDYHKNPSDSYLHEHFESGTQTINQHLSLSGTPSISECVSMAFEKAEKVIPWKFSGTKITPGTDFCGPA